MITLLALLLAATAVIRSARARPVKTPRWPTIVVGTLLLAVAAAAAPEAIVLQKAIGRACLPMGLLWLFLLARTVLSAGRGDSRGAWRVGALAVAFTIIGNEPLGQALMERLEAPYQADPFSEAPFDAIIVLGGGAKAGPHEHHELGPAGDRIFLGARLLLAGKTPTLVTTGSPIDGFQGAFDGVAATARLWAEVGVPASAIVQVGQTRTTAEEAVACANLIAQRRWRRVGLISSAWHLRRAEALFGRTNSSGATIVALAADHRGVPSWEGLYSLVPVGNGAWLQQKAMWEIIGAAVGR